MLIVSQFLNLISSRENVWWFFEYWFLSKYWLFQINLFTLAKDWCTSFLYIDYSRVSQPFLSLGTLGQLNQHFSEPLYAISWNPNVPRWPSWETLNFVLVRIMKCPDWQHLPWLQFPFLSILTKIFCLFVCLFNSLRTWGRRDDFFFSAKCLGMKVCVTGRRKKKFEVEVNFFADKNAPLPFTKDLGQNWEKMNELRVRS